MKRKVQKSGSRTFPLLEPAGFGNEPASTNVILIIEQASVKPYLITYKIRALTVEEAYTYPHASLLKVSSTSKTFSSSHM